MPLHILLPMRLRTVVHIRLGRPIYYFFSLLLALDRPGASFATMYFLKRDRSVFWPAKVVEAWFPGPARSGTTLTSPQNTHKIRDKSGLGIMLDVDLAADT